MSTPNTPLPHRPPERDTAEVPTAAAELQILLFPTDLGNEIGTVNQPQWSPGTAGWITQLTFAAFLMAGTLLVANLIHLRPAATVVIVLTELVTVFVIAQFRRSSRHK